MLIYVTGVPGTGKTTLCRELVTRGYDARDADEQISEWSQGEWRYDIGRTAVSSNVRSSLCSAPWRRQGLRAPRRSSCVASSSASAS